MKQVIKSGYPTEWTAETRNDPPMRILDLFCGAGVVGRGLRDACPDAVIFGADNNRRALKYYSLKIIGHHEKTDLAAPGVIRRLISDFQPSFIWASPPCRQFSTLNRTPRAYYPDFIALTRAEITRAGVPGVIENVEKAPIRADIVLTGQHFPNTLADFIHRKRHFEAINWSPPMLQPAPTEKPLYTATICRRMAWITGGRRKENGFPDDHHNRIPTAEINRRYGISDCVIPRYHIAEGVPPQFARRVMELFIAAANGAEAGQTSKQP